MDALALLLSQPGLSETGRGLAELMAWLILILPMLAAISLWQHWRREQTEAPMVVGILSGVLWTIWTVLWLFGALPPDLFGQLAPWLSILLFGGTMYDWGRCLFILRPSMGDVLVLALCLTVIGLGIGVWINRAGGEDTATLPVQQAWPLPT